MAIFVSFKRRCLVFCPNTLSASGTLTGVPKQFCSQLENVFPDTVLETVVHSKDDNAWQITLGVYHILDIYLCPLYPFHIGFYLSSPN